MSVEDQPRFGLPSMSRNICVNLTSFLVKDSINNMSKICLDSWIPGDIILMEIVS